MECACRIGNGRCFGVCASGRFFGRHAARTFTPWIPAPVRLLVIRPVIDPVLCAQSSDAKITTANMNLAKPICAASSLPPILPKAIHTVSGELFVPGVIRDHSPSLVDVNLPVLCARDCEPADKWPRRVKTF